MRIKDLYERAVRTAEVDDTLAVAISKMHFHEVGSLPVHDRGTLAGIITDATCCARWPRRPIPRRRRSAFT